MKRMITASSISDFESFKQKLQSNVANGIDPIYEQTYAGEIVEDLARMVEEEMHLYVEPSIQAGFGGVWIYDNNTHKTLVQNLDYFDWGSYLIDAVLEADNEAEALQNIRKTYAHILERYAYEDENGGEEVDEYVWWFIEGKLENTIKNLAEEYNDKSLYVKSINSEREHGQFASYNVDIASELSDKVYRCTLVMIQDPYDELVWDVYDFRVKEIENNIN